MVLRLLNSRGAGVPDIVELQLLGLEGLVAARRLPNDEEKVCSLKKQLGS